MCKGNDGKDGQASPDWAPLGEDSLDPARLHAFNSQVFGYRGNRPQWRAVSGRDRLLAPYRRVCAVRCEHNVHGINQGSGWHLESGVVLTAAHVVDGFQRFFIRFANSNAWIEIPKTSIKVDPGYAPDGKARECSQFDISRIHVPPIDGEDFGEPFSLPDDGDLFRAIGFQGDILVEHAGVGGFVGNFVTYEAETGGNHSGCPIFHHGDACGIHVGYFSGSSKYLAATDKDKPGYLNSAINITA